MPLSRCVYVLFNTFCVCSVCVLFTFHIYMFHLCSIYVPCLFCLCSVYVCLCFVFVPSMFRLHSIKVPCMVCLCYICVLYTSVSILVMIICVCDIDHDRHICVILAIIMIITYMCDIGQSSSNVWYWAIIIICVILGNHHHICVILGNDHDHHIYVWYWAIIIIRVILGNDHDHHMCVILGNDHHMCDIGQWVEMRADSWVARISSHPLMPHQPSSSSQFF